MSNRYVYGVVDSDTEAIAGFEADHDELMVQCTGPFAPYSFVDVKIGAQ